MDRDKIKIDSNYNYATPSSEGRFKVTELTQGPDNSWWVVGYDKAKGKDIKVRPGQVSK